MKNHVKKFGSFVNEGRKFRSELVGGMGQKAQYDALDRETQAELEDSFAELSGDPELARAFVRKLSRYSSIEDIQASLQSMLSVLRNPGADQGAADWDMNNY